MCATFMNILIENFECECQQTAACFSGFVYLRYYIQINSIYLDRCRFGFPFDCLPSFVLSFFLNKKSQQRAELFTFPPLYIQTMSATLFIWQWSQATKVARNMIINRLCQRNKEKWNAVPIKWIERKINASQRETKCSRSTSSTAITNRLAHHCNVFCTVVH